MQAKWQMRSWATAEFLLFVSLFYWGNLFIALMALIGCFVIQWIFLSQPSNARTKMMETLAICVATVTISLAAFGGFSGSTKIKWPEWYVFGQSAKTTTLPKEKWKELLNSLNGIANRMDRHADGQDALRKEIAESQKSLTEEVRRGTKIAEEARDAAKAVAEKAELDSAALQGKRDAIRDFEKGDTRKASPSLTLPEFPAEELPQITIPRKAPPKEQVEPAEPESKREDPRGFRLPTRKDDMPTAEPIPQTGPKQPTPELRAKVTPSEKKKGRPTFVICSCKNCEDHKHPITGWYDFNKDGVVEPKYDPCFFADTGKAACSFKDWAWEK